MNGQANDAPERPLNPPVVAAVPAKQRMYWSIRRELWENRSIYVAPLAVAGVILFGFLLRTISLPRRMREALELNPVKQHAAINMPYHIAAFLIFLTAFLVAIFYCLDALHGERRDRSILFWKSLPVSDLTTVLSKASIPLVVLPIIVYVIVVSVQLIMLLMSSVVLLGSGPSLAALWAQVPLFQTAIATLYGLIAIALWHAPIYGWLLLISAWARRATFLWAFLPLLAICILEKIAMNTSHFADLLKYRVLGWFVRAFVSSEQAGEVFHPLAQLTPGRFLCTPGLWIGLMFAAIFLAVAVRLRRYREPI
jgi:ABC-2 type transport system permease protein